MSSVLAIASVTQVLKSLLNDGLIDRDIIDQVGGPVAVTALPPDRIDTENEQSQLNLFMYLATPNPGWRNHDLPSHNAKGERTANPPLALDLHYLLTAYGGHELHHEILLGHGMLLLHENPVLPREAIRKALTLQSAHISGTLPENLKTLSTSGLQDQIEQIKITPEALNTEEISRLWTAFGAKYRPNAAYKVTVVLIESQKAAKPALPVRHRNLYVLPFRQPVIEKISSQIALDRPISEDQKILPEHYLVISGTQLKGAFVQVMVGSTVLTPAENQITDSRIVVQLLPNLKAGIHPVQVVHRHMMGSPEVPHQGVSSNVQALLLCPVITEPFPPPIVTTTNPVTNKPVQNITLTINPGVNSTQKVVLLLNEINPSNSTPPRAYSFQVEPDSLPTQSTATITITAEGIKSGQYLVRIRIDGAESPLGINDSFQYSTPTITIL